MVLSIDASLSCSGICVMNENLEVMHLSKFTTTNKLNEDDRIFNICKEIESILNQFNIKDVVIEGQFVCRNSKTAMQLSRLRGAITYMCKINNANIHYMQPSTVKKIITGNGNSSKEEVAQDILNRYKNNVFIKDLVPFCDRSCKAKNSDMYDAVAIALAYCST